MTRPSEVPIQYLKGIGPKRAKSFAGLGITTVEDLLYYFPRRYEDRRNLMPISKLEEGVTCTIQANILAKGQRQSFRRRRFSITEVAVGDNTGRLTCVWFNQPYIKDYFKVGQSVILFGKVDKYGSRLQMSNPEFEIVSEDDEALSTGRITPIYTVAEHTTQRTFRRLIKSSLEEYLPKINEFISFELRSRNNLLNLAQALRSIHFPETPELQRQAYERLSFEEFFIFQLPLALRKISRKEEAGISHRIEGSLLERFLNNLTFRLTAAQEKVFQEIKADLARPQAMQRLLQGDVGSGKTVVATLAAIIAIQGGYQVALMVPTEILAKQHYEKISSQLIALSSEKNIKTVLLTSGLNKKVKEGLYKEISQGKVNLVIGTHALLQEEVTFKKLGLVVIDEQHKFGVGQRALLPKKGSNPDILIMTATPIPRTLAITLYGDLDVSIIDELPPGRQPISTLALSESQRHKAHAAVIKELERGNQAYIIYPVIEESFALDLSGAKKMYDELRVGVFKKYRLGLIHGRLAQKEQDEVMSAFKKRELDILIATTVLEVGIDIPTATCMVIEHAERFGLSQLHQLRGRIGRGTQESFCVLVSEAQTEDAKARLAAMVRYSDGFKIAEEDLKIRGPGEFFGRRQHGLTDLKIGNPLTQMQLLKRSREEAIKLVSADPRLEDRNNIHLKEKLLQRFPEYEKIMVVG